MLPLPSRTHPQKQNLVVYTEELTHLFAFNAHEWITDTLSSAIAQTWGRKLQ
jgi:hypothetical protein